MTTLSRQTAIEIARAWKDIEIAETLLNEIEEIIEKYSTTNISNDLHLNPLGLQLSMPRGISRDRLFNVPLDMFRPIILAYIARMQALIESLSAQARIELEEKAP